MALEALKGEVTDIRNRLHMTETYIRENERVIGVNSAQLADNNKNMQNKIVSFNYQHDLVLHLQDLAHESEYAIFENRRMLVLYCQ